ncbi:MAG: DUF63 family protein [Candidatus Diapherotrites archaeon]|nr:DUF63 family protein [Candidatus Diapherotrites archaeon]
MVDVIDEFFIKPIFHGGGYNLVNTLFFAAVLIAAVFVLFRVFSRFNVKIDEKFFYYLLPFIFFGSVMRSLVDVSEKALRHGEVPIIPVDVAWVVLLLKTPGIYFFVFLIVAFLLVLPRILSFFGVAKNLGYRELLFYPGLALAAVPVILALSEFVAPLYFAAIFAAGFALVFVLKKLAVLFNSKILDKKNSWVLGAHVLDGTATFVGVGLLGCYEQHVVSSAVIGLFSPLAFPVAKVLLVLVVLHFFDKDIESEDERNFYKLVVFILGAAPGLRDVFSIGLGICGI